jgi:probable phosphoglycerate mutase
MNPASVTTRFGLIRHAETVWNREKRIQGHLDSPLTSEGECRADRWGLKLREFQWERILSSDTGRAVTTARRINAYLGLPLETDPRLRELDWGEWAGKTVAQLRREQADVLAVQERAGWDFRPPQGESRRNQLERICQALLEAASRRPGDSILVVTHGGVLRSLALGLGGSGLAGVDDIGAKDYWLHWLSVADRRLALDRPNGLALP